jgi:hypothetical protein
MTAPFPPYHQLPEITALRARHSWGVFGHPDDLGRVNLMSPQVVAQAARAVKDGTIFTLALPLDLPEPPWGTYRSSYVHHIYDINRNSQDDYLDSFYLQRSTQWDGFRHIRAREFGYYGGVSAEDAGPRGHRLGIEHWARHGLVGRGVLADVAGYLASSGRPLDPRAGTPITVADLQLTLDSEKVELAVGDILMVRTGYLDAYLAAPPDERQDMSTDRSCPGLFAGEEMAAFLWDSGVAAVVADNPAVEVVPGDPRDGSLHRRLIPLLGFPLGELFVLGELARACADDGRYTCLFVSAPLNLPGGVGSPGNAVAIR